MPYAVITGGTHGIGKAIAEKLLQHDFSVAVCARNEEELKTLEAYWNDKHPAVSVLCYKADMAEKEEVLAFSDNILANFPQVDMLVNNAGVYFPGSLAEEPDGNLENMMQVHLFGAYHLTRALLPAMKENSSAHIFNICSIASLAAYNNGGAYSIAKYALLGFSENLRHELKQDKIKVTSVIPGAVYSRSWAFSGLPHERFMKAEDIAKMVWAAYDLSEQANVDTIVMRPLEGDI